MESSLMEEFISELERAGWRVSGDFLVEGDEIVTTTPAAQECDFLVSEEWCIPVTPGAKEWFAKAQREAWQDQNADSPSAYCH
jgi:hypothetical protein